MTSLLLEIAQNNLPILANQKTKCFEQLGGTIGRGNNNDWVLSDAKCHISSLHAEIEYANNTYYLTDVSTNGVFIDGNRAPLGRGNRIQIQDKMRLTIGDYEIDANLKPSGALQTGRDPVQNQDNLSLLFSSTDSNPSPIEGLISNAAPDYSVAPKSTQGSDADAIDPLEALLGDEPTGNSHLQQQIDESRSDEPYQPSYSEHANGGDFIDSVFTDTHNNDHPINHNTSLPSNTADDEASEAPLDVFSIPDNWDKTEWGKAPEPDSNSLAVNKLKENPKKNNEENSQGSIPHRSPHSTSLSALPQDLPDNDDALIINSNAQVKHNREAPLKVNDSAPSIASTAANTTTKYASKNNNTPHAKPTINTEPTPKGNINENAAIIPMLQAMGVDTTDLDSDTIATQWINMMPLILDGLIKMLHIRGEIKSQFRAEQTTMRVTENNPLKFSSDASMAIHNLFISPLQGFKGPDAAMGEVLHDLAVHQQAMTAGLQSGFEEFISRLSPEEIDKKTKRISGDSPNFLNKIIGAKHWPVYVETYNTVMKGSHDSFLKLFGRKFASTYEEYLRDHRYQANSENNPD